MTALGMLSEQIAKIGYSTIETDYVFSDVFQASGVNRKVPLAAFTHAPPSYRNAALAAVESDGRDAIDVAIEYRALGAPLLFVVEGQRVTVWQIHPELRPTIHREVELSQLSALFSENRETWTPQRIQNAKSFGLLNQSYQLDFVDAGLLPAIEGEIHSKLDRLLNETLAETVRLRIIRAGERVDQQLVFRTVFRLLAAKVLQDRGHELARTWDSENIDSVLAGISGYYKLPLLPGERGSFKGTAFDSAWTLLRRGINFRNISSDDLAFVYENTLVTEETRKHFGTHSTPRPMAEYVVDRLELWRHDVSQLNVYEPFAGAGVFLVAALRKMRDLLPIGMSEVDRHRFLVNRITGDEIDPFAAEVATLSLILADYPNDNGWAISKVDLFDNFVLRERVKGARVVLCNPPFEAFNMNERTKYPDAFARSPFKPIAALDATLDAKPEAIGFVLPEPFIEGKQYELQRQRVEQLYRDIEVVALPDRMFKASVIRSSLLIAREPRRGDAVTSLRSTIVAVRDRERFLKTGEVTEIRARARQLGSTFGDLWVKELDEVWEYLSQLPALHSVAEVHKGFEWRGGQSNAVSDRKKDGFGPGVHAANSVHAFALDKPVYLDSRPGSVAERTAAHKRPWQKPKLLVNAARLSRGPWCFAAALDAKKLLASQQLFGIWPASESRISLNWLCAILNGPVAIAYIASHSPPDRIRLGTINSVPIPPYMPSGLDELVLDYLAIMAERAGLFAKDFDERANQALYKIDAAILESYDLPPRLERQVLEYFRGEIRPTLHEWRHWFPENFRPFIPLQEYLSLEYQKITHAWIQEVFAPLPPEEAEALSDYMD
jgi:hypothetical protein